MGSYVYIYYYHIIDEVNLTGVVIMNNFKNAFYTHMTFSPCIANFVNSDALRTLY